MFQGFLMKLSLISCAGRLFWGLIPPCLSAASLSGCRADFGMASPASLCFTLMTPECLLFETLWLDTLRLFLLPLPSYVIKSGQPRQSYASFRQSGTFNYPSTASHSSTFNHSSHASHASHASHSSASGKPCQPAGPLSPPLLVPRRRHRPPDGLPEVRPCTGPAGWQRVGL